MSLWSLSGCSPGYLLQAARGQWQLLRARQPISALIDAPDTDAALRSRLQLVRDARDFASTELGLPDNQSYRSFAALGRPYVVWNVVAAPEFAVTPLHWCFPIAGCVAYRGYYSQGAARGEAALLKQQGMDVSIGGVEAYSTLGWFNDPIMSSMLSWGDERLATLIFHELAHQRFYVKDDTEFNESFATFVEQEGTRQWRVARGLAPIGSAALQQRDQFTRLVLDTRKRLETLYAQPLAADAMRRAKAAEFERLRSEYRQVRDSQWGGDKRYDAWVNQPMNNARLLPFGLYDQWVPAFAALFRQEGENWLKFYAAVERMGQLPVAQRKAALRQLEGVGR